MGEPALKRPKLLASVPRQNWSRWSGNLRCLQEKLLSACLCNVDTIELQRPVVPSSWSSSSADSFPHEYTLQFISTINLLSDVALGQHTKGFICPKVLDMATGVSTDEGIWELLLESLNSPDRFISHATSKCLVSFLMWTKLPNLDDIFSDLFNSVFGDSEMNPRKLNQTLEVIRGIVEFKDEDDHPLDLPNEQDSSRAVASEADAAALPSRMRQASIPCMKVEVDTEIESEVKNMCIKSLESWWTRLLSKFHNLLSNYEDKNEAPILTFLSLWQSVISVKANLSVVETKHFHMQLESFVPHLNSTLPPVLWKKILDVFSEILCYGSTLSLQDCLADEPCNLAHLIIRCVKNRHFLQGVPYCRHFTGFGGSSVGPVDWEWESVLPAKTSQPQHPFYKYSFESQPGSSKSFTSNSFNNLRSSNQKPHVHPFHEFPSKSAITGRGSDSETHSPKPGTSSSFLKNTLGNPSSCSTPSSPPKPLPYEIRTTIYIGPSPSAIKLDENYYEESGGDRSLLQKLVLVVLKSVAVTVKETRDESDSDDSASNSSDSESVGNDMVIIERSIREVFQQVDAFVKSLLPFHPATPLGEWMVKLFSDQDDALVEAMLCALDTFTGFHGRVQQIPPYLQTTLNPVVTFIAFARTVSEDRDVLLDLLMSNETSFLLYFLRFLKFCWKNWPEFVSDCGRDLEKIMGLLIRLRIAIGRLVEKSLFPYNINPVLRLLERCEEVYEANSSKAS